MVGGGWISRFGLSVSRFSVLGSVLSTSSRAGSLPLPLPLPLLPTRVFLSPNTPLSSLLLIHYPPNLPRLLPVLSIPSASVSIGRNVDYPA